MYRILPTFIRVFARASKFILVKLTDVRWGEHNNGEKGTSEPAKHLREYPTQLNSEM